MGECPRHRYRAGDSVVPVGDPSDALYELEVSRQLGLGEPRIMLPPVVLGQCSIHSWVIPPMSIPEPIGMSGSTSRSISEYRG